MAEHHGPSGPIPPAAHNLAQASPALLSQPCLPAPRLPAVIDLSPWLITMPILHHGSQLCLSCHVVRANQTLKRAHDETHNDGVIILRAAYCAYTLMWVSQAVRSLKQFAKQDLAG